MKKLVSFTLVIILAFTLLVGCSNSTENYTLHNCKVYDVHKYGNEVAIIDENMEVWTFIDENFTNNIGDTCTLIMNDNGTPNNIFDDVIVDIII